jgi:cysteine desulfurase
VLSACARLEREGHPVTYVAPDANGRVAPSAVREAIDENTALVSVMHANNETGVIQAVREISEIAREAGAVFHVDGVQAAMKLSIELDGSGIDLYSVSGHKFGAPKGAGALYVRDGVVLDPILYGGRHERERRAGTENVPGIVAMAEASRLNYGSAEIARLRDRLESGIGERVPGTVSIGARERVPNTASIRFDGIGGEAMTIALDLRGFAVSSGSACSSGAVEPSHVLLAMGLTPEEARSSVRFSLGPENTAEDVEGLIEAVAECAAQLRRVSATYRAPEAVHA